MDASTIEGKRMRMLLEGLSEAWGEDLYSTEWWQWAVHMALLWRIADALEGIHDRS